MKIGLIITTYNRPNALKLVLDALAAQTVLPYEVLIADDGSTTETKTILHELAPTLPYMLKHCWQEDDGFRVARARNLAIVSSTSDYLIFLDGDCVPLVNFVENHRDLAELGWFVAGNRVLLNRCFTNLILEKHITIYNYKFHHWVMQYLNRRINRILPLCPFYLSPSWRVFFPRRWQGAKSCNLAIWRRDLLDVNGFDENFQGWGYEDSDLAVRLIRHNIYRKSGYFLVPVIHLWHPVQNRDHEILNRKRLEISINNTEIIAKYGLQQHSKNQP